MDEEEYTDLEFGPLRLVPSRDMVFKPCDDLKNNVRPKAFFVYPEAQYLRHMQDEGEGLTQLRVWTRNYFPKGKTQSIRAMGISTC